MQNTLADTLAEEKRCMKPKLIFCCAAENFANRSQAMTEDEKVLRLADMGFSKDAAIVALQTANGDENSALELLLAAI